MHKHLPDPFYLEGNQRISVLNIIARELCVNMIIHRDYSSHYAGRLIIEKNEIHIENPNIPKRSGYVDINHYVPYTKNPIIASFFREIGYADELGSGIRKLKKYVPIYSQELPVLKEGELFVTKVPIHFFDYLNETNEIIREYNYKETGKYENIILHFCETEKSNKE